MKLNRDGFGLLEYVLSLVVLGIVAVALSRLQKSTFKGVATALDQSAMARSLYLVQGDLVKDDRYLPAQEFPSDADPLDHATLDKYLDDPEVGQLRCFDRFGGDVKPLPPSTDCAQNLSTFFRVVYAKFRQPDVSFYKNPENPGASPQNELNRLPIGLYRMRVDYSPDKLGKMQKQIFMSRVVTSAIAY